MRASSARFDAALKHPHLTSLRLVVEEAGDVMLARLTSAALPALRRLELHARTLARPRDELSAALTKAFGGRLEHLDVRGGEAPFLALGAPPGEALLTERDVLDRAEDERSIEAARAIARPAAWETLARDGDRLWGRHRGSVGTYGVLASVEDDAVASCSCPSTKRPCKHVLALLLLAAAGATFAAAPVPAALTRRATRYTSSYE